MDQNTITCKHCSNQFTGKYCNVCGEKVYSLEDKSIIHFFSEALHFITHFEGTLFTTLKAMFTSPGLITTDYCNGVRKKYFKPLSFFLLLVFLYLLFPVFEGLNMKLEFYPNQDYYGNYAAKKIQTVLSNTGMTMEELSEKFHTKGEKISKFLLVILVPVTALFFYAIGFMKRRFYFDNMVFSAEVNSFFLLWGFLCLPLITTVTNIISNALFHEMLPFRDNILGILIYVPLCIYVAIGVRKFYHYKLWVSILIVPFFYFVHTFIVYSLYKFLLFVTTINQIH
ncbi:DUF3667 domain-containing protein [Lacibacter sediminis]|uniref:DUF3667 domain-containing protein n=1 Tax=Lacibacter sediminis TaxID=2760713 RepID=A0A7G5XH78_9BACT|nr:DUF3667 domain-containing protein [Lacibacter sediminis]QNA44831.1 DUF3667 domain-containing protein [Lacibacter sediminis]